MLKLFFTVSLLLLVFVKNNEAQDPCGCPNCPNCSCPNCPNCPNCPPPAPAPCPNCKSGIPHPEN